VNRPVMLIPIQLQGVEAPANFNQTIVAVQTREAHGRYSEPARPEPLSSRTKLPCLRAMRASRYPSVRGFFFRLDLHYAR
jgi:hypothetical protein